MTAPVRFLTILYKASLRLFPGHYQSEYGREMKAVFTEACCEAAAGSSGMLWLLAFREARDLPINLVREHLAEFKRGIMQTPSRPDESFTRAVLRAALVFGVGFTLVFATITLLDTLLNSGESMYGTGSILIGRWTYAQALACGIGTAWLGIKTSRPRAWAAGLAVFLGVSLFYRLEMYIPLFHSPVTVQPAALRVFTALFPEAIKGLMVGIGLAWVLGKVKIWGLYGLAGSLGLTLGYLTIALLGSSVVSQLQALAGTNQVNIGGLWYFVYELGLMIPYGFVIGAFLGAAASRGGSQVSTILAA